MFAKEMKELMDTLYNIRFPTSVRVNLQNDARITGSILFGFASHSKELIAIGCISVVNRSSQPPRPTHITDYTHVFMFLSSIKCPNV